MAAELPQDGTDRVTTEIAKHISELIQQVQPLSRDFSRGATFGITTQFDAEVETGRPGALLETILMNMRENAPEESDLFYVGAVLGSTLMKASIEDLDLPRR